MLEQAVELEVIGTQLSKGMESEITVSIDHLCCRDWLYRPLAEFVAKHRGTSVQIIETSLSSTKAAVTEQTADVAIINLPIADHLAEAFGVVTMVPVISRHHPLAQASAICIEDMTTEMQIVARWLTVSGAAAPCPAKERANGGCRDGTVYAIVEGCEAALGIGFTRKRHTVSSTAAGMGEQRLL